MKHLIAATLGALLALSTGLVSAQVYKSELSVFGSFDSADEPEEYDLSIFNLRYGYYLTEQALATVGLSRTHFDTVNTDTTTTALTAGAKYYFGLPAERQILPFAEAAVGFARTDTGIHDGTDFTWEFGGGAAYFVSQATSLDASLRWYKTDTDAGDTDGIKLLLGLTTRF